MYIEVDEREISNMKEDIEGYVNLIKRYDNLLKIKNNIIEEDEENLNKSKEIMLCLIDLILTKELTDQEFDVIDDIKATIEQM